MVGVGAEGEEGGSQGLLDSREKSDRNERVKKEQGKEQRQDPPFTGAEHRLQFELGEGTRKKYQLGAAAQQQLKSDGPDKMAQVDSGDASEQNDSEQVGSKLSVDYLEVLPSDKHQIPTLLGAATLEASVLSLQAWERLSMENKTLIDLVPMALSKLEASKAGDPVMPDKSKSVHQIFGSEGFPPFEYRSTDGHKESFRNALGVFVYWKAMLKLTRPWWVIVSKLVPGIYALTVNIVTVFVVNAATTDQGAQNFWIGALVLLLMYQIKLYGEWVYMRDVPGAAIRYLFRTLVAAKLDQVQSESGTHLNPGAVGVILSESVRNSVSVWTTFFRVVEALSTSLFMLIYILVLTSTTLSAWLSSLAVYFVIMLTSSLVFLSRQRPRSKLQKLQLDWRVRYTSSSAKYLEKSSNMTLEAYSANALAYRKRAFQRYMYDLATNLAISDLSFLAYFSTLLIVGFLLESVPPEEYGTYTGLLLAAKESGEAVESLFRDFVSISTKLPDLELVSSILNSAGDDQLVGSAQHRDREPGPANGQSNERSDMAADHEPDAPALV